MHLALIRSIQELSMKRPGFYVLVQIPTNAVSVARSFPGKGQIGNMGTGTYFYTLRTGFMHPSEGIGSCGLLFKDQRRTADAVGYKIDSHLYAVGNLNERNATIHSVFLPVKGHGSFNFAVAAPLCAGDS